jgi:hypothetical protein
MPRVSHQIESSEKRHRFSTSGAILLVASVLEVLGMLHHPSVQTTDIAHAVEQITQLAPLSAFVHAALIALMLLIAYGFVDFTVRRGLNRPFVRAGAICYAAGIAFMTAAALVSGFMVSNLTSLTPHVTALDLQIASQLLTLCWVLNQGCAGFAVVAMSVGIACWSLDLCRHSGLNRGVGTFGCVVGLLPAVALIFGKFHLDVHGMTAVVMVQATWNVAVAILMQQRDFDG